MSRRIAALVAVLLLAGWPRPCEADAVDDAFRRGNEAAARGEWTQAIADYEEAARLLPEPNSALAYNLGTAYAHVGELGHATYHLRRALDLPAGPSAEIAEAARFNLSVVRRRAELQATSSGAQIDRPQTWWDLVVASLRARFVGTLALIAGWSFVLAYVWRRRRLRRVAGSGAVLGATMVVLAALYLVPGSLHALAMRADRTAPDAIVILGRVDARDGAGQHRKISFVLQGGSRVRMIDRTPGWVHVRLPGGLEGWVPQDAVARLDHGRDRRPTVLTSPTLGESTTPVENDPPQGR